MSSHVDDFNTRNKVLTAKFFRQGYRYHKLRNFDIVSKHNVGLKIFLQGLSEPEFYGDLVYKFRKKYLVKMIFLIIFKKIIFRFKKIGYNINVLRQTACLVVNPG